MSSIFGEKNMNYKNLRFDAYIFYMKILTHYSKKFSIFYKNIKIINDEFEISMLKPIVGKEKIMINYNDKYDKFIFDFDMDEYNPQYTSIVKIIFLFFNFMSEILKTYFLQLVLNYLTEPCLIRVNKYFFDDYLKTKRKMIKRDLDGFNFIENLNLIFFNKDILFFPKQNHENYIEKFHDIFNDLINKISLDIFKKKLISLLDSILITKLKTNNHKIIENDSRERYINRCFLNFYRNMNLYFKECLDLLEQVKNWEIICSELLDKYSFLYQDEIYDDSIIEKNYKYIKNEMFKISSRLEVEDIGNYPLEYNENDILFNYNTFLLSKIKKEMGNKESIDENDMENDISIFEDLIFTELDSKIKSYSLKEHYKQSLVMNYFKNNIHGVNEYFINSLYSNLCIIFPSRIHMYYEYGKEFILELNEYKISYFHPLNKINDLQVEDNVKTIEFTKKFDISKKSKIAVLNYIPKSISINFNNRIIPFYNHINFHILLHVLFKIVSVNYSKKNFLPKFGYGADKHFFESNYGLLNDVNFFNNYYFFIGNRYLLKNKKRSMTLENVINSKLSLFYSQNQFSEKTFDIERIIYIFFSHHFNDLKLLRDINDKEDGDAKKYSIFEYYKKYNSNNKIFDFELIQNDFILPFDNQKYLNNFLHSEFNLDDFIGIQRFNTIPLMFLFVGVNNSKTLNFKMSNFNMVQILTKDIKCEEFIFKVDIVVFSVIYKNEKRGKMIYLHELDPSFMYDRMNNFICFDNWEVKNIMLNSDFKSIEYKNYNSSKKDEYYNYYNVESIIGIELLLFIVEKENRNFSRFGYKIDNSNITISN
jgi:hypothetical protein